MSSHNKPVEAFVAIGSNIAPREHIPKALDLLRTYVRVTSASTFYATPSLGRPELPEYRNGVLKIETSHMPFTLKFHVMRPIEDTLGRVRSDDRYAPRTIDLDVILYGEQVVEEEGLIIPDPGIWERSFVAVPLLELAPGLVIPGTGETLAELDASKRSEELRADDVLTKTLRERLKS